LAGENRAAVNPRRAGVAPFLALLCSACGEVGVSVAVSQAADVPPLDALRVQVTQGPLLVEQSFSLSGRSLPQSVAAVSKGLTRGQGDVLVQGVSATGRIEALGRGQGDLQPATQGSRVEVRLDRLCEPGSSACGCTPTLCPSSRACGRLSDGCFGT